MALKSLGSYWFAPCTSLTFLFHVHVQPGGARTRSSVAPKGDCKCSTGVSPNDAGGQLLLCASGLFGFQDAFFAPVLLHLLAHQVRMKCGSSRLWWGGKGGDAAQVLAVPVSCSEAEGRSREDANPWEGGRGIHSPLAGSTMGLLPPGSLLGSEGPGTSMAESRWCSLFAYLFSFFGL